MKEKWIQWRPNILINQRYNIKSVIDSIGGFQIILFANGAKDIRVTFIENVEAYRCVDEGLALQLLNDLEADYGRDFYAKWNFFKVENSSYIKWLVSSYAGFDNEYADTIGLKHFVFMDDNNILDIVATYEPVIELIE